MQKKEDRKNTNASGLDLNESQISKHTAINEQSQMRIPEEKVGYNYRNSTFIMN
jgi:hypothetical protein